MLTGSWQVGIWRHGSRRLRRATRTRSAAARLHNVKEEQVQAVFVAWLLERGWRDIVTSKREVDVIAKRGAETLIAEVKGTTSEPGLDTDTLMGQILRAMDGDEMTSYAVVVPEALAGKVQRVPADMRRRLDLTVYLVDDFGHVRRLED